MKILRVLLKPQLLFVIVFAAITFVALLGIRTLAPAPSATSRPIATVASLQPLTLDSLGLSLQVPSNWQPPVNDSAESFVLSPTGDPSTTTTAGPFMNVIVDALPVFQRKLAFRTDFTSPTDQLNALLTALNRNGPRFKETPLYAGLKYPAAMVRGFERGNELTILLMKTPTRGWIFVGTQARQADYDYLEKAVFQPVTESLVVR